MSMFSRQPFGTDGYSGATSSADSTCCCGATCCGCSTNPSQWQFTLAGVTNNACLDCTDYNRTWTLTRLNDGTCTWQDDATITPCEVTPTDSYAWQLFCDTALNKWFLNTLNTEVTYNLAGASWDCDGPNTMNYGGAVGTCLNWPATITLSAA